MDDLTSFENYCIVCDRLIVAAPAAPNPSDPVAKPKKKAQGAIRIKNPDGTTTIRTASGVKTTTTTRPTLNNLRRTNSTVRLAGQTGDKSTKRSSSGSSGGNSGNESGAPPSPQPMSSIDKPTATATTTTPNPNEPPPTPPFVSNIYCSQECQDKDVVSAPAAYEDMARAFGLGIKTDFMGGFAARVSPVGPPSPLLGSDTDTNSSTSVSIAATMLAPKRQNGSHNDGFPAASAPKTMEYFRIGRDLPDEVWADLERQRRKSISNGQTKIGGTGGQLLQMTRQRSGQSQSGTSSDSLSSLWHGNPDDVAVHRPGSGNGFLRGFTAAHPGVHRSLSAASVEASAGTPPSLAAGVRPIPRSALSQTSLGGLPSPGPGSFAEVGSAPSHNAFLMQAYASNFPNRDGATASVKGSYSGTSTPNIESARNSISGASLQRPTSGTIRSRGRTNSGAATWDSLGKAEVIERSRRSRLDSTGSDIEFESPVSPEMTRGRSASVAFDVTPKQSLEIENGSWQIRYPAPMAKYAIRASSRSRSRSRPRRGSSSPTEPPIVEGQPTTHASVLALPIPSRATRASAAVLASSNSTARARTPQQSRSVHTPPVLSSSTRLRTSYTALPDLAALRIGSTGCATTFVSPDQASSVPSRSAPRPGFDWDGKSNHLTYELPTGVVANPNKGLFYFNA
ncbi:hypothetical protein Q8F55_000297 [Vanrija albida]|uniref:Uncharacterized protein n=1 Tax=Vanrija albida TaxID=181172 RepID=A0ABR3QCV4_9TREE